MIPSVTEELAQFVAQYKAEDIPAAVRHEAKRAILNGFATALAAANDPGIDTLVRSGLRYGGSPVANLIGRPDRMDLLSAISVNAAAMNVYDFDDTHPGTILHPTAPVAPVLFALSQTQPISGRDLLDAFIIGVEVECTVANAVSPGHYRKGWHITATCGVFGAAAAAGRIMRLDGAKMHNALGIASAQASGLVETLGTMAKSVGVGNAARNGLWSAILAAEGLDGPEAPLEGERGFLRVFCDTPDLALARPCVSGHWQLVSNTYKPYPCGVVLNPLIEACLDAAKDIDPRTIEQINVMGHPLLRERTDRPNLATGRESQVSAQHAAAVALIRGRAGLPEFSDAAVLDPAVRALASRVTVQDASDLDVGQVRLEICQRGKEPILVTVLAAKGDSMRPLTDNDLENKMRELAREASPEFDPTRLIDAIWTLDESNYADTVMHCLQHTH